MFKHLENQEYIRNMSNKCRKFWRILKKWEKYYENLRKFWKKPYEVWEIYLFIEFRENCW